MSGERRLLVEDGKLLVLSWAFPPMPIGTAFVIGTLLSPFDPEGVIVFAGDPGKNGDHPPGLAVRRYDLPRWWPEDTVLRLGRFELPLRLRALGNVAVGLRAAAAAARVLRRRDVKGVLAVYPKQHFLLAACVASAVTRKPLLVFFMDVYVEGLPRGRRVARLIDRYVARRATAAFVLNEAQRKRLLRTWASYGGGNARAVEVPVPYAPRPGESQLPAGLSGRPSILFTGTIYEAQADAIARLIESLDSRELDDLDPQLHLLTQTPREVLARHGIRDGERVHVRRAPLDEVRAAQRAADILFLPLSFDAVVAVVETTSPSKLPEYLAAGRPILIHAPANSYLVAYAQQYGCAEVVAEPDVDGLAQALRRLATDAARRRELSELSDRTLERHALENVARLFGGEIAAAIEP